MTRRGLIAGLLATGFVALTGLIYGLIVEPMLRLRIRRYRVENPQWTLPPLRIAVLSDLHVGPPSVTLDRLRKIVARTNALGADLIVIPGDLTATHRFVTRRVHVSHVAEVLADLRAPLGVFGCPGNHDWWDDCVAQTLHDYPLRATVAFANNGMKMLVNEAEKLTHQGQGFWLAGLDSQLAIFTPDGLRGRHDVPATLAQITDDAPAILLAHEPAIFPRLPDRFCLTLSGHTHGGQIRLLGWTPVANTDPALAHGHIRDGQRDLVVSAGIGCSVVPIRIGVPPEIVVIDLVSA